MRCSRHVAPLVFLGFCLGAFLLALLSASVAPAQPAQTIYVDSSAAPGGDGSSWSTAYRHLQDALPTSSNGDEIWVAQGTYRPDQGTGIPDGKRDTSFHLKRGVALYGGFDGTETERSDRNPDPATNGTVLSADLSRDDSSRYTNRSDNALHVIIADSTTDSTTVLDGFALSGADGGGFYLGASLSSGKRAAPPPDAPCDSLARWGGGICNRGHPTFSNLLLEKNRKHVAAALYNARGTRPTFQNVTIEENRGELSVIENYNSSAMFGNVIVENNVNEYGPTLLNTNSSTRFRNVVFQNNQGTHPSLIGEGAVLNDNSDPVFIGVTFDGNLGTDGGAMTNLASTPLLINVKFANNGVTGDGGALHNLGGSSPYLFNVLFYNNFTTDFFSGDGGAIYNSGNCAPRIVNATFIGNNTDARESTDGRGGAMYDAGNAVVRNSIFWNNGAEHEGNQIYNAGDAAADIDTSLVQGGYSAGSPSLIFSGDPLIADPSGGDFNLTEGSPALDAGGNDYLPPDTLDLDADGDSSETLPLDLEETSRINDNDASEETPARVDLGAYEAPPGVIPVELTSFTGTVDEESAHLRWRTASETNNAGFRVEHRPPDADAWTPVGSVDGAGTTSRPQNYRFRTEALAPGRHAFRLRQVDLDGSTETHGPVRVQVGLSERFLLSTPSPNPVRRQATVRVASREGESVRVVLYDALGRRVQTLHDGSLPAGQVKTLRLGTETLASGRYFLRLIGPDGTGRTRSLSVVR
ncbi:MAG: hypothetical protein BRD42_11025 [Bacteroidetes bacterium QS_3_64_15]|nr:MAG: hypothetical protein BRD42_11025 [Bacteroidetes bacterium QS_3_64_15]